MLLTSKTDVLSQCYILAIFWKSWSPAPAASRKRRKEWKEIQMQIEIQTCTKYFYLYLCISCLSVCICSCISGVSVYSHRCWGSIFLYSNFSYLCSGKVEHCKTTQRQRWWWWACELKKKTRRKGDDGTMIWNWTFLIIVQLTQLPRVAWIDRSETTFFMTSFGPE